MLIRRREFLKYCIGAAASLGLPLSVLGKLERAYAQDDPSLPNVIWLNGANCTGCTVSLANRTHTDAPRDLLDLLLEHIDLVFHPNLMGASGDQAVRSLRQTVDAGNYILAIDGGIPTAFDGHTCIMWTENGRDVTAVEAVRTLAPKASAVLAIGTCASHGGISAGAPNPTGIKSVEAITAQPTINIPGCPAHPDWIIWTVAHLLAGQWPVLDGQGRPAQLYAQDVHKRCPRKGLETAKFFGQENSCLKSLGCKGPRTKADCAVRQWNNGINWCIGANAICLGCTEAGFPDAFSPFYKFEYGYKTYPKAEDPPTEDTNPGDGSKLRITKAEWRREKSELRVEGDGVAPGRIIKISNSDIGVLIGAVSSGSDGRWKFRQTKPNPVPVRVDAESGGIIVTTVVRVRN